MLTLLVMVGHAQGTVSTPTIHSHEAAFAAAVIVARGEIVAYDMQRGATFRVSRVLRGNANAGAEYRLNGSGGVSSLAALPRDVTAFASRIEGQTLHLWQGPTNGGLITSAPLLLDQISRAQADPRSALVAKLPRERLAGAYFLAKKCLADGQRKPLASDLEGQMVESAAWGLAQESAQANQAALDTLAALGHALPSLGITYHPYFKIDLKHEAAAGLRAWWAARR